MQNTYPRGSEWRRWDLHLHTPETLKEDRFTGKTPEEKWENFCTTINKSTEEIAVVGVTDYLLIDNYEKFLSLIASGKITKKFDLIIPNLELRLTPITAHGSALNLHLLINPDFVPQIEGRIYSRLTLKHGGTQYNATRNELIRLGKTINSSLTDEDAYKEGARKFVIDFDTLKTVFDNDQDLLNHCLVVVSNNSSDGASGITKHSAFFTENTSDLDVKRQAVYKLSKAIFSANPSDRDYFLSKSVDNNDKVIEKCGSLKPCIHGCDAHENAKVFNPDGNRYCWIKADPTFEGLKQIIYEPEERVHIGPIKPDQKDLYKVIRKIHFPNSTDFPEEIEFNDNLSSIIGSRSSGKSALLAYLAHAIDPDMTEQLIRGPGEGAEYHWENIRMDHTVEWGNGKSNEENPGKIVYIRQNYLFEESKDPNVIKTKIEPVLFKTLPGIEVEYSQTEIGIAATNQTIHDQVDTWFELTDKSRELEEELKNLGDKNAVEGSRKNLEERIEDLKIKNSLSAEEVEKYQKLNRDAGEISKRITNIDSELAVLSEKSPGSNFFSSAKVTLSPGFSNLSKSLQDSLIEILSSAEKDVLLTANEQVANYRKEIIQEKEKVQDDLNKCVSTTKI